VQDSIQALVEDCNFPAIKKSKNIESFLTRCKFGLLMHLIRVKQTNGLMLCVKPISQLRFDDDTMMPFDYDESDRNFDTRSIRLRYEAGACGKS